MLKESNCNPELIASTEARRALNIWRVALGWNVISWLIISKIGSQILLRRDAIDILIELFFVSGVILIIIALFETWHWFQLRKIKLQILSTPVALGGALTALVRGEGKIPGEKGFFLRLNCIRRYAVSSPQSRSMQEETLWSTEQSIESNANGVIQILFAIPADGVSSTNLDPDNCILWRVQIINAGLWRNLFLEYEIPVLAMPIPEAQKQLLPI